MQAAGENKLFRRHVALHSAAGRWRLNAGARWQRWLWRVQTMSGAVAERAVDSIASAIFLIVFSPLYLLLAGLIRLEDGGPALFAQTRVGRFGQVFKMYKFRSMGPDAEARLQEVLARNQHKQGVTFKIKDDPRLTRVGKWLRKFSFDELPQVWNVFKGEMSLVGPRPPPCPARWRNTLADRRRLAVKPGITCLWQIGGRSNIDFSGQVKLDVQYIETANLATDFNILFKTLPAVVAGKGAC